MQNVINLNKRINFEAGIDNLYSLSKNKTFAFFMY